MKTFVLFILLSLGSINLQAQQRRENIEAMRVAYITREVSLSPEEAQRFWPVYNQYQNEIETLRKDRRQKIQAAKINRANLSDKDYEVLVDNEMAFKQKELDIERKYNSKFKEVLPIEKVARLYKAQESFKVELLRKLKDDH